MKDIKETNEPIPWHMVERGKCYELQSVTSQDDRLQSRIGAPFVRRVAHERTFWGKAAGGFSTFTRDSKFATVEPKTEENEAHVKVRFCANYIVLCHVSE